MRELTPSEVVIWCRGQAKKFNDIADTIENTFQSNATMSLGLTVPAPANGDRDQAIVQRVQTVLSDKAKRLGELSVLTGATKRELRRLLTPEKGFELAERGWVKFAAKN